jgi:prevent-host-death family protein
MAVLTEPGRVDEPGEGKEFSEVLSQVASDHRPIIIRRDGTDLAAVISLEHWELLREVLARQEIEKLAPQIDWDQVAQNHPPAKEWFDGEEPKPF